MDYMGNDTVLVVPREIDGYSVSIIARKAFLSVAEIVKETKEDVPPLLKKVTLPETVTVIEAEAFYGQGALEEINIPTKKVYLYVQ